MSIGCARRPSTIVLGLAGGALLALGASAATAVAASAPSTELVSLTSTGAQVDGDVSSEASMTPDGRFVVFTSSSPNLAPGAAGGTGAFVYLRDRTLATTELVSRAGDGGPPNGNSANGLGPPVISADGRYVAFASQASNLVVGDTNNAVDIFVRDRLEA